MAIMRRSAPHAPTKRGLRASERRGAATIARLAASEPRIEDRIEKVHGEVQDHEGGGEEQNHALDHRVVALEDRVEQQPPDAGQGEDVFDHDDAAHDVAELDAGDRDDGDQRVAERVVEGHPALGQPLGARRANVLAPEAVEHRRAGHAGDHRRRRRPQRDRRDRHRQEAPKSPRRTDASHSMYWRWTGRSSPKKRRNAASTSGEAIAAWPRSCSTTVPGTNRIIVKMSRLTPRSVSAIAARRWRRYARIAGYDDTPVRFRATPSAGRRGSPSGAARSP